MIPPREESSKKEKLIKFLKENALFPDDTDAIESERALRGTNFTPSEKQKKFLALKATSVLLSAGNRFGKTYVGSYALSRHLLGVYPDWWEGHRFDFPVNAWAVAVTKESIARVIGGYLLGSSNLPSLLPKSSIVSVSGGLGDRTTSISVRHRTGGISKVSFKSYSSKGDSFASERVNFIMLDEPPPLGVYGECFMRLTDVKDGNGQGKMIITATPISNGVKGNIPFFLQFMKSYDPETKTNVTIPPEKVVDDRVYINATWSDAPHLSEETKNLLRAQYDEKELEAREKGIPYFYAGLVHPFAPKDIVVPPFEIPKHWPRICGMDFGWTSPTAVVFIAVDRDSDRKYVYGEYKRAKLTFREHTLELQKLGVDKIPTYCDPAGKGSEISSGNNVISMYRTAGLKINPINRQKTPFGNNSYRRPKEFAIDRINQWLGDGTLKVFSSCVEWLSEFSSYARDENGEVVDGNDHLMDATQYACVEISRAATETEYSIKEKYERAGPMI